jgi:Actin
MADDDGGKNANVLPTPPRVSVVHGNGGPPYSGNEVEVGNSGDKVDGVTVLEPGRSLWRLGTVSLDAELDPSSGNSLENRHGRVVGDLDRPAAVVEASICRPLGMPVMVGMGAKDSYVGVEEHTSVVGRTISTGGGAGDGWQHPGYLRAHTRPISARRVENWDDCEKVLHNAFYYQMRAAPEEWCLFTVVEPSGSREEIEKWCAIAIETFSVPCLIFASKPECVVEFLGLGGRAAVVVDVGSDVTTAAVVNAEGVLVAESVSIFAELGMEKLAEALMARVAPRCPDVEVRPGVWSVTTVDIYSRLTAHLCCRPHRAGGGDEWKELDPITVELPKEIPRGENSPDAIVLTGPDRVECTEEIFFQEGPDSLPSRVLACIRENLSSDTDNNNIVLIGGGALLPGLGPRLEAELRLLGLTSANVSVPDDPDTVAYRAAADFAVRVCPDPAVHKEEPFLELAAGKLWTTRDEYEDRGPQVAQITPVASFPPRQSGSLTKPARRRG